MACILSGNDRMLAHFENIHLKLYTHSYFEECFHPILSKYNNSNNFCDFITSELYDTMSRRES